MMRTAVTVELCPGGADVEVTSENKLSYVYAVADYHLRHKLERAKRQRTGY